MMKRDPRKLLDQLLKKKGSEAVGSILEELLNEATTRNETLTIVANAGVHAIPKQYLRGEVFEASRGDWNISSQQALVEELKTILSNLVIKLRSKPWQRVYLVPTGHPILSLQIKTMVYRVLRINTIDLYHKSGSYLEVDIDQRAIAIETVKGS